MSSQSVPIESTEVAKKSKKEVTFARPVFARELMSDEAQKNFDSLPSWQRHMIKRMIDHGDLEKAAQEAGVSTYVKKNVDIELADQKSIAQALEEGGLDNGTLVEHLKQCLHGETIRFDKHQNPIPCVDLNLKLKTIELIAKLKGLYNKEKDGGDPSKKALELFKDTEV